MDQPAFDGIIKITGPTIHDLPDAPLPYYMGAKNGLYLHRRMLLGRGIVKVPFWPENWPSFNSEIDFDWQVDPIPAKLMGQIVDFFRRIYDRQKGEAAVLLTMNYQTKEWGVFIPTQLVSGGGVNYVFDPTHIRSPHVVVGSAHSHCMMGAFHSGTDTGDADEFDGFHLTIGKVMYEQPEFAAMMAMHKKRINYASAGFPAIMDLSEINKHSAPAWWDRYVGYGDTKPAGFKLYDVFKKSTVVKDEKKVYQPTQQTGKGQHGLVVYGGGRPSSPSMWDFTAPPEANPENAKRMLASNYQWDPKAKHWKYEYPGHKTVTAQPLTESRTFNARRAAERGVHWGTSEDEFGLSGPMSEDDEWFARMMAVRYGLNEGFWEDGLPTHFVTAIVDSGLFGDEDWDYAIQNPTECGDIAYWKEQALRKALQANELLRTLGMDVSLIVKSTPTTPDEKQIVITIPEPPANEVQPDVH